MQRCIARFRSSALVFRCCLVVARFVCVCAVSVVADVDLSVGAVLHMGFIFSGVWD